MTGNVVLLGFGIAGAAGLPVVSPLVSLAAFLLGVAAGGLLAARVADRHHVHLRAALLIEFSLTAIALVAGTSYAELTRRHQGRAGTG